MERLQHICDGCGVTKGESNHWFRMRIHDAMHVYPWTFFGEGGSEPAMKILHLCGHACVQKKLSEWMGETVETKGV